MISDSNTDVSIRRPRPGDWGGVMKILEEANFHRIGGPEMRRFEPGDCFVAELAGKVVGVAGYAMIDPETAKTTLLAVDRTARRRGVGSALQRRRLDYLREQGVRVVYTNCDDEAVIAWNCGHFGFFPTGRVIPKEESFGRPDRNSWTNLRMELDPQSTALRPDLPADCDPGATVHDITDGQSNDELKSAVTEVTEAMQRNQDGFLRQHFRPEADAVAAVSEEALAPLLATKAWVSDIVENRQISNCIAYNFDNVADAVMDDRLATLRRRLDAVMLERARVLFPGIPGVSVENTGHFWYPDGGYMGWHTNLRTPGWRCYISVAEEPDRSFFRYRDPRDGRLVTSWDRTWNVRLFHITPAAPLWHAVYSETNRISLGYKILLA